MNLVARGPSQVHPDDIGEPSTGKPRLSVSALDCAFLRTFARSQSVVEIGTGLGVSTRALADTARVVTTIDIDPWVHKYIWPTLPLANVSCHKDREHVPPAEFVFIDGDHTTSAVRADIAFARTLSPRLIACHDANYESVRDAFDGQWIIIPTEHGLAVQYQ